MNPPSSSQDGGSLFGGPPDRLGDFRILREIGRGGMGMVYEAIQESLGRRVAVKVLGPHIVGSPTEVQRFRREAEAAANLHHTNIVPVFGIAEHDKVPFFAMQFIDGPTLEDVLRFMRKQGSPRSLSGIISSWGRSEASRGDGSPPLPLDDETLLEPPLSRENFERRSSVPMTNRDRRLFNPDDGRLAARIVEALADATHYAHSHGVLHRDIKPGNILIDRSGVPWISDFGLAKGPGAEDLTEPGDLVGTLRYMAPEQLSGRADERSDIHSLGLTLHELISLELPFGDVGTDGLIYEKTHAQVPELSALLKGVPKDLEIIAGKACSLDPSDRYQSAKDLAEDLRRYLNDMPIRARKLGYFERGQRWVRRNPAIASLAASSLLLLLTVIAVVAVGEHRTRMALIRAQEAAKREQDESQRAESNLRLALQALESVMENIGRRGMAFSIPLNLAGETELVQEMVVTQADANLLEELLSFFDTFAQENKTSLNRESAKAYSRIGSIQHRLGHLEAAEKAYLRAIDRYDTTIDSAGPADSQEFEKVLERAKAWNGIGLVYADWGDTVSAFRAHREAAGSLSVQTEWLEGEDFAYEYMRALNWRNSVGIRSGRESFTHRRTELELRESVWRRRAQRRRVRQEEIRLSPIAFQDAVDWAQVLVKIHPHEPLYQLALSDAHQNQMRYLLKESHEWDLARMCAMKSAAILEALVAQYPENPRFRVALAQLLSDPSLVLARVESGQTHDALDRALRLSQDLTEIYPDVPEYKALHARTERARARDCFDGGMRDDACQTYEKCLRLQKELASEYPEVSLYQVSYAQTLEEWGILLERQGRGPEAVDVFREAWGVAKRAGQARSERTYYQRYATLLERRLKAAEGKTGKRRRRDS